LRRKQNDIARITAERDALAARTLAFAEDVTMLPTRIAQRLQHLSESDMAAIVDLVRELFEDQMRPDYGLH
jgi:hypothetical protein